jgi:hypothetical protein
MHVYLENDDGKIVQPGTIKLRSHVEVVLEFSFARHYGLNDISISNEQSGTWNALSAVYRAGERQGEHPTDTQIHYPSINTKSNRNQCRTIVSP